MLAYVENSLILTILYSYFKNTFNVYFVIYDQ